MFSIEVCLFSSVIPKHVDAFWHKFKICVTFEIGPLQVMRHSVPFFSNEVSCTAVWVSEGMPGKLPVPQ